MAVERFRVVAINDRTLGRCDDLSGFYWTDSEDPDLDPQGPFPTVAAAFDNSQIAPR